MRVSEAYQYGARNFTNTVQANAGNPEKVLCPCKCCKNLFHQDFDIMYGHLIINGMDPTYTTWVFHGEKLNAASLPHQNRENLETYKMYRYAFFEDDNIVEPNSENRERDFSNLYEGVEIPLYPGCTMDTRISAIVVVYKLKATHGISDNGFNELLETTAREFILITWKSWKDINESFLDDIWEHVQQKFDVDNCHRKYIMQKLGKHWRDHRSNVLKAINNIGMKDDITRAAALLKPDNVSSMEEWQAFVKERNCQPYKEKSEIFKKMRASRAIMHTMSRKGFARLEVELCVESEDPDSITRDDIYIRGHTRKNGEPINELARETLQKIKAYSEMVNSPSKHSLKDDGVAKVLGPERRGWVRGLGFGATPSKLNALVHNHNVQSQL